MAKIDTPVQLTRDLKDVVSAIVQGYRCGQQPVTDTSAELHRLCGCLEQLLQFEQKEQKRILRAPRGYWDFFCMALSQQRGDTESVCFVHSQNKLQTPLGKGRAFIRFCLVHGQLAESLQLCLLDSKFTREWYGPRSPLLCPKLQEDLLDSLYALNAVTFNLDLQRADLDEAWPMFSESYYSSHNPGRRPRRTKESPKEPSVLCGSSESIQPAESQTNQTDYLQETPSEDLLAAFSSSQHLMSQDPSSGKKSKDSKSFTPTSHLKEADGERLQRDSGSPKRGICLENSMPSNEKQDMGVLGALTCTTVAEVGSTGVLPGTEGGTKAEKAGIERLLASSPRGTIGDTVGGIWQEWEVPSISGEPRVLQSLKTSKDFITEKSQEPAGVAKGTRKEEPAAVALQAKAEPPGLRTPNKIHPLEQLLEEREEQLKVLQEQLQRCQEEKAQLQAQLQREHQEAERRDAVFEEELGRQQDLVRTMKRRVLELIQEKDSLWQKTQQLSSTAPGCCVGCSKIFGRLSRRYPCRLCGSLVCHACSVDYKKQACRCPPCIQKGDTQAH
ncbi:RUN and FYVE domain-containing protein 4 [Suncus etruscus]|uniref:RUN and FYVE domain-containing protein 4 n=1 Tax=Suncus etruscus TaxID=109475 RepID=UPI00210F60D5|nr:RUN and FYVE domain-containing protein 4 [Suncus etruscus]